MQNRALSANLRQPQLPALIGRPPPDVTVPKPAIAAEPRLTLVTDGRSAGAERAAAESVGKVAPAEVALATTTIIGNFHAGFRAGKGVDPKAARLLTQGFEADKAGNPEKALACYAGAAQGVRDTIARALGPELASVGIAGDWLSAQHNDGMLGIAIRQALDANPEALTDPRKSEAVTLALMYLNRKGLAFKHQSDGGGEYALAGMYFELAAHVDPKYGPARYNMASTIARAAMRESDPALREQGIGEALKHLESALAASNKNVDFKALALGDTDWNALRREPTFRELVGLPPLPARTDDLALDVFASDPRWQKLEGGGRYTQRYFIDGDQLWTETKVNTRVPLDALVSGLRSPEFWSGGVIEDWKAAGEESFSYRLWPAGKLSKLGIDFGIKVDEVQEKPRTLEDGSIAIPVRLSGHAEGLAYFLAKPKADGSIDLAGRFAGVKEHALLFSHEQFAKNHLLGERGGLRESFMNRMLGLPSGTGIGPMIERLEQAHAGEK